MTESIIANKMIDLGRLQTSRYILLRVIPLRFPGLLTPDMEQAINDQTSLPRMRAWVDAAFAAESAEEFVNELHR